MRCLVIALDRLTPAASPLARLVVAATLAVLPSPSLSAGQSAAREIQWEESFDSARTAARRTQRLLLIKPLGARAAFGGAW
jgi:hypothetical protein